MCLLQQQTYILLSNIMKYYDKGITPDKYNIICDCKTCIEILGRSKVYYVKPVISSGMLSVESFFVCLYGENVWQTFFTVIIIRLL